MMWVEGEEDIVRLPEDDQSIFVLYVQLLYQGRLPITRAMSKVHGQSDKEWECDVIAAVSREYDLLARLYVFCEKIQDSTGKIAVITGWIEEGKIVRHGTYCASLRAVNIVFAGTTEADPLRSLIIDTYVSNGYSDWVENARWKIIPTNSPSGSF
jgi:hypothetical protein